MNNQLANTVNFDFIRYANCWEDADLLLEALRVQGGDSVISIASAGDNSFSFLTTDNVQVHGVDINETQIHLCVFKKIAIQYLSYNEYMQLMGFIENKDRLLLFESIKTHLPADTLAWSMQMKKSIEKGLINTGKFEKYFYLFRTFIFPLIHGSGTIKQLFAPKNEQEQKAFYTQKFNTWRWRFLFKIFFSKFVMGRAGRDPVFLDQVQLSVGDFIFKKAQRHLCSVACQNNYFLQFIFTGKFGTVLPYYIRPENFETIKKNIANIHFHVGYVQDITARMPQYFTHANLSNIFEYMNQETFASIANNLHTSMHSGARLAYWNLMVDRDLANRNNMYTDNDAKYNTIDNGFFYKRFKLSTKI